MQQTHKITLNNGMQYFTDTAYPNYLMNIARTSVTFDMSYHKKVVGSMIIKEVLTEDFKRILGK